MRKDDGLLDGASGTGREIDRRTIAKGVAWTVPAVIVATAAPAAATSRMTANPALTSVELDTHPTGLPSFRFVGTCPSNEAGSIQFLLLTQGSSSASLTTELTLVVGNNPFDVTVDPSFSVQPGQVAIAYTFLDTKRAQRGQGNLLGTVAPYATVTGASQGGNGSTRTITFTIGNHNPKSALVISSVKDSGGSSWTDVSRSSWEDIGTGTVSFTAKRTSKDASARVVGTIDAQAFDVTATA
jgi:hypothetical protein